MRIIIYQMAWHPSISSTIRVVDCQLKFDFTSYFDFLKRGLELDFTVIIGSSIKHMIKYGLVIKRIIISSKLNLNWIIRTVK